VIKGGWAAVNDVFLKEAEPVVLEELRKLPNGAKLDEHIGNLRSGKTSANRIERELLPYGGMMEVAVKATQVSAADMKELEEALEEFQPDEEHIQQVKNLSLVQSFGGKWQHGVQAAIADRPELAGRWQAVVQAARAYELWSRAYAVLTPPVSERARAEVQAELSEYETYLPMFGKDGMRLLSRLRAFVSSV
jgi:hypothetical protein